MKTILAALAVLGLVGGAAAQPIPANTVAIWGNDSVTGLPCVISATATCQANPGAAAGAFGAALPPQGVALGANYLGNLVSLQADASGNFYVNCRVGCAPGATTAASGGAAVAANSTLFGAEFFTSPPSTATNAYQYPLRLGPHGELLGAFVDNTGAEVNAVGSLSPAIAGSAASSVVAKASAGNLYSAYVTPTVSGYLMLFNATALPANGATTAGIASGNMEDCVAAPASVTTSINYAPGPPEAFSTGVVAAFSSTGCATLTASTSAYIHASAQ